MSDTVSRRALFTRFPMGVFVLLIIAAIVLDRRLAWPLPAFEHRIWIGFGLVVFALLIVGWAVLEMHAKRTSPLPWKESVTLVEYGPYRFSRNPIYLGDVLALVGLALVLGDTWLLIVAMVAMPVMTLLVIRHEEAYLEERFGDRWRAYRVKVRRWI